MNAISGTISPLPRTLRYLDLSNNKFSPPAAAAVPFLYETELPPHATGAQQWALEQVRLARSAAAREQSAEARDERARQLAALVPDETALVALASAGHDEARRES